MAVHFAGCFLQPLPHAVGNTNGQEPAAQLVSLAQTAVSQDCLEGALVVGGVQGDEGEHLTLRVSALRVAPVVLQLLGRLGGDVATNEDEVCGIIVRHRAQ